MAEGIEDIAEPCRPAEPLGSCLLPLLRRLAAHEGFQRGIEPHLLALAVERDGEAVPADLGADAHRPEQHRGDARLHGSAGRLEDEEGKAQVQAVDAGVALVEPGMLMEHPHALVQDRALAEHRRVDLRRLARAVDDALDHRRRRAAHAVELDGVDPGGGLADGHAGKRPALDRGRDLLLEERDQLADVLLACGLLPARLRHRQQHERARKRTAAVEAELVGPFVDARDVATGEIRDPLRHQPEHLPARSLDHGGSRRVGIEGLDAGGLGEVARLRDDVIDVAELADRRAEQDDQVLVEGLAAVDDGGKAAVVGVGQELAPLLPQGAQPGRRPRQEIEAQVGLVELDLVVRGALAHGLGAAFQLGKPGLGVQLRQHVGRLARDEGIAGLRVLREPAGGDDVAADHERQIGVEGLEG